MTPDHLHVTNSIAAMKKRKHVLVHKPLANRVAEVRMVVETARKTGVATHLLAWQGPINVVRDMIQDGAIGTLREVHNWTDRPASKQKAERWMIPSSARLDGEGEHGAKRESRFGLSER
jgi:predicted dehydrogenase